MLTAQQLGNFAHESCNSGIANTSLCLQNLHCDVIRSQGLGLVLGLVFTEFIA